MDIRDGIYGGAIGDAFGVPFEFWDSKKIKYKIKNYMTGNGTHNQPKGTWSDDTSLTLCLLDNIEREIDYKIIMDSFVQWYKFGKYTSNGDCFDIGRGTRIAINRFIQGVSPIKCGSKRISNNGNGSLMRMLPVIYYFYCCNQEIQREVVHNICSLTHGHKISLMVCDMYVSFGYRLLCGMNMELAYRQAIEETISYWGEYDVQDINELFNVFNTKYNELSGSGYVVTTLQSVVWCLLNTKSYEECILKCVKIGGDTDTIASVAGGLAGIVYGKEAIPKTWLSDLRNKELIERICIKWENKFV